MYDGVPGGGSVSVVTDGSAVGFVAGDEYGRAHVGRVGGGSHVSAVLAFGCVGSVAHGSRVGLVGARTVKAWLLLAWWAWVVVWACWVSMLVLGSLWRRIVCLARRVLRGFLAPGCGVRVAAVVCGWGRAAVTVFW